MLYAQYTDIFFVNTNFTLYVIYRDIPKYSYL